MVTSPITNRWLGLEDYMSNNGTSRIGRRTIIAVALACLVLAVMTMATLWQAAVHHSLANDAQTHANTAALFVSAETEAKTSSQLVQQYVVSGDATLIPQVQAHTQAGVQQLTSAIQLAGSDPNGFIDTGSLMVQAGGKAIALRQSGDVQGAVALLTGASAQFNAYIAAQDQFIASEQAASASALSSADNAKTATIWLAIFAGVYGAVIVAGGLVVVSRSARRGAVGTAPSV
jgi:CHASE3 domain sensor protein